MNSKNFDDDKQLCDDRKKTFDIAHSHFISTMTEISKLRSKSLLFDVTIKSGGRSFQVSTLTVLM